MNIAILTSPDQWFVEHAKVLAKKLHFADLYFDHIELKKPYQILFILSYYKIIDNNFLKQNSHNIVVHASSLPKGKGWSPIFWQVINGKNEITFTMFEADKLVDNGDIYMTEKLTLSGVELNSEIRIKQAELTIKMCTKFVEKYPKYTKKTPQKGEETFFRKRNPNDSELDAFKPINEQFDLLRTVDNEIYPAFFMYRGKKWILKIYSGD